MCRPSNAMLPNAAVGTASDVVANVVHDAAAPNAPCVSCRTTTPDPFMVSSSGAK